jgi:hypothetical protein
VFEKAPNSEESPKVFFNDLKKPLNPLKGTLKQNLLSLVPFRGFRGFV